MPRRKKVLLVDDEPAILMSLMRSLLSDNHLYDVMVALSGETAQQIVREQPIHALITDIAMPGLSGIDLMMWVAEESPSTQVAVVAGNISDISDQAFALGAVSVVEKPVQVAQLRRLVSSMLDNTTFMSGRLARLSLADLVQMFCLSQQSLGLRVEEGDESGLLTISGGRLCHAVWGDLVGEEAVYRALKVQDGGFHTYQYPADAPTTVASDWQQLLMEGMRRLDEEAHLAEEPDQAFIEAIEEKTGQLKIASLLELKEGDGPSSTKPVRQVPHSPKQATKLLEEGSELLSKGDKLGAMRCWRVARLFDPDNEMVEKNLRELEGGMRSAE